MEGTESGNIAFLAFARGGESAPAADRNQTARAPLQNEWPPNRSPKTHDECMSKICVQCGGPAAEVYPVNPNVCKSCADGPTATDPENLPSGIINPESPQSHPSPAVPSGSPRTGAAGVSNLRRGDGRWVPLYINGPSLISVCCECQKIYGASVGAAVDRTELSHGYCKDCFKAVLKRGL
jgi:hypothetical protein